MNAENKFQLMIWAIVILAIMNISTLATIMYRKYHPEKSVTVSDQKRLDADSEKFSGGFFCDKLNLNGEQMEKFRNMCHVFRPQARDITIELAQKRVQLLIEMSGSGIDTVRLNALSDSIGQLHTDLKKVTYRYYLEIKTICDTMQQIKLKELFGEMFTNDSQYGFQGNGGQRGMMPGR